MTFLTTKDIPVASGGGCDASGDPLGHQTRGRWALSARVWDVLKNIFLFSIFFLVCRRWWQCVESKRYLGKLQASSQTLACPPESPVKDGEVRHSLHLFAEALKYAYQASRESGMPHSLEERLAQIQDNFERTGTYWQMTEELIYGARVAWRNSSRCIGRLHWQSLRVRDLRHISTAEDLFAALVEHLRQATNGGKICPMISIFAPQLPGEPGIRIWNSQLIRYAGYRQPDGSVIGDSMQVKLTSILQDMGWKGGKGTHFDVLPLIIQMPHQPPQIFELPADAVLEVPLSHPDYPWFESLGLKWHTLPVISNMCLEIGGISYTAAPFNGWYMSSEIGARNLADTGRYHMLPLIAQHMGLDTSSDRTLWKDRALVELNVAVLSSFARHKVTIVDHHTASRQFVRHQEREQQAGRSLPADWGWIVPPLSGSLTSVFHQSYEDHLLLPNFFAQSDPWEHSQSTPDNEREQITDKKGKPCGFHMEGAEEGARV